MSPSSERRLFWSRTGAAGGLALIGLLGPATAFGVPAGSTTPVVPIETSLIAFAGGTAELDGSTTLERTRTGTRSRIDCTILFAKDSDQLRPGAGEKLHRLAGQLQRQGPGRVKVTGYTDDLGSVAHGLDLSRRRAQQVATALAETLPGTMFPMTVRGRGEADPAVPNTSETNRRKNRRVTAILTTTPPQATANPTAPTEPTTQPTPMTTATAAAPTAQARTPDTVPSPAPTPTEPSTAPTPAPPSQPGNTPPSGWPLPVGIGLTLILLGALLDQIRRRHGPATGPTPDRNPPPPGDGGAATTADAQDSLAAAAATPTPPPTVSPTTPEPSSPPTPDGSSPGTSNPAAPAVPRKPGTTNLDEDLMAWFSPHTHRPRLTLLGPVHARAHGQALARRRPYYTELLAYLTLKPHGATIDDIADTFTLTTARVRTDMKILRDWLGTNPTNGQPYLPDARTSPAALQQGLPTYQVQNVLCDYHLFTQLHTRATAGTAEACVADLETALRLVTGEPFSHTRTNGWHWIFEGNRLDLQVGVAIVTVKDSAAGHRHQRTAQLPEAAPTAAANTR